MAWVLSWGAGALASAACRDLLPSLSDPQRPGLVLVAETLGVNLGSQAEQEVQRQILENLPEGTPTLKIKAHSPWVRDWFPIVVPGRDSEGWRYIQFIPQNSHGQESAKLIGRVLAESGIQVEEVPAYLDWGNAISDGKKLFVSQSLDWISNNLSLGISPADFHKLIKEKLSLDVVWLPEFPREATGHLDIYLSYVGDGRFVVADSRDEDRKQALDKAASILLRLGYQVTRIMNAHHDEGSSVYSYTNSFIIGNRALVPVYSAYAKRALMASLGQKMWWQILSLFDSDLAKRKLDRQDRLQRSFAQDDLAAMNAYAELGFEVYPIVMNKIVECDGMVHCLTRSLPAGFNQGEALVLPLGFRIPRVGRFGF